MRGTCEIQDQDKTATVGDTSWRYIKRLFLEDGRDYDMLSCPAHVVNNLVFETEKLKKLKRLRKAEKVYTCTWYVAYVAYAREKFWNMCACHVYIV